MPRLILFGGTFDPIHKGHMLLAKEVFARFSADKLILMPTYMPPHKGSTQKATSEERYEMCTLAASELPGATVSDYEISQGGVSYSFYTVEWLKKTYPGWEICFLMGGDMLITFQGWYKWRELLKSCVLLANARTIDPEEQTVLEAKAEWLRGQGGDVRLFNLKPFPISSGEIRTLAAQGKEIACYLPETVVQYLHTHKIY